MGGSATVDFVTRGSRWLRIYRWPRTASRRGLSRVRVWMPLRFSDLVSGSLETPTPAELDKAHLWHPFTPMTEWCAESHEPLFIERGEGVYLWDVEGNRYLDGNSTIWTNLHGHRHPTIDAALRGQLERIAHVSALGFANEPAAHLAAALVGQFPPESLTRVFLSDDGSTAIECACKMAQQYFQLTGQAGRNRFISFDGAYHGDTAGAASLGGIDAFHQRFRRDGFDVEIVPDLAGLDGLAHEDFAAVIIEPLIQGAAGMRTWPKGMLRELRIWCDAHGVLLILDEVMTGFGRTGTMFACQQEDVIPDFLCLAKGLTGGYLPLAATLTTERVFDAFLGDVSRAFYYGHSYCANPLGCAAALGSLQVFEEERVIESLPEKIEALRESLDRHFPATDRRISGVRQVGLIAGIDLVNPESSQRLGSEVCFAARQYGLLTRPVRDTLVFMPPLAITPHEIETGVKALSRALTDVLEKS